MLVDGKPFSLTCSIKELTYFGSGIPLYFNFIKAIIILLLITTLTSGLMSFYELIQAVRKVISGDYTHDYGSDFELRYLLYGWCFKSKFIEGKEY